MLLQSPCIFFSIFINTVVHASLADLSTWSSLAFRALLSLTCWSQWPFPHLSPEKKEYPGCYVYSMCHTQSAWFCRGNALSSVGWGIVTSTNRDPGQVGAGTAPAWCHPPVECLPGETWPLCFHPALQWDRFLRSTETLSDPTTPVQLRLPRLCLSCRNLSDERARQVRRGPGVLGGQRHPEIIRIQFQYAFHLAFHLLFCFYWFSFPKCSSF